MVASSDLFITLTFLRRTRGFQKEVLGSKALLLLPTTASVPARVAEAHAAYSQI